MRRYLLNLLIALDQLANAVLLGDPDETISSRVAKRAHRRGWVVIARLLEAIDPGHLKRAIEPDEGDDAVWK